MLARSIITKAATASVRAIRPVARASHTLKVRIKIRGKNHTCSLFFWRWAEY